MDLVELLEQEFKENDIRKYFNLTELLSKKEKLTKDNQEIYDTIINIAMLSEDYKDVKKPFSKVNFYKKIEDLDDKKLKKIEKLKIDDFPNVLSARINDVLWVKFNNIDCAISAVDKYLKLFEITYNQEHWTTCINYICRATIISAQTDKEEVYQKCIKIIETKLDELDGKDESFLSFNLVKLLVSQKIKDKDKLNNWIDTIITNAKVNNNVRKVGYAYELKLKIEKNKENKKQIQCEFAEYYEMMSDSKSDTDSREIYTKIYYLENAVHNYNEAGEKEKSNLAMKKLEIAQKDINKCMMKITTGEYDFSKEYKEIKKSFKGLTFQEALIRLTHYTRFFKKADLRKDVIKDSKEMISMSLMGEKIVDKDGKTLIEIPPLKETDEEIIELYMNRKAYTYENIDGSILDMILKYIRDDYKFEKEDLNFIVNNNLIIPNKREKIMLNGIYIGLMGDYYTALHILAPQMENLFRNIAKECGGVTVALKNDNTSRVKVLSSVFEIEELNDCYNENILFLFKGLLNEQSGGNIRNIIGHGIMDEIEANSALGAYFLSAVIKLICLTSIEVNNIMETSKRLKEI